MPTLVSLFSGCGGMDLGLSRAGFECLTAIEMWEEAAASLRENSIARRIFVEKLENVQSAQILQSAGLRIGELDLLAGGPPCPPFSKSRFYRTDKPRALADPAANTIPEFLRVLRDLRPKAFLMENVPGLAYKVHADALDLIKTEAGECGYDVSYAVLNAADYGVPQIRHRLFIVGHRNSSTPFRFPDASYANITPGELPIRRPWVTAGEVLADLDTDENAQDYGHRAGGKHLDLLRQVPPGDNYLFFTKERGHPNPQFKWRSRYWSFLLKLSPDRPSWTIQARRSNNMGPFHWRNRILRIDEIRRLQTFPDDYRFIGKVDSVWRQIGNAVPPRLAEALGRSIAAHLAVSGNERTEAASVGR